MQTRSQRYATAAYGKVTDLKKAAQGDDHLRKEYGALALSFPVLVLQAGLAQACGFVLAKQRPAQLCYLDDLATVLGEDGGRRLHEKVIASDLSTYQHLTRCTLDAAGWFKRYAQGELRVLVTDGEVA